MRAKVQKWGNSLALRIPKAVAASAEITEGTEVELTVRDGRLVIVPVERELTLDEMLDLGTPENQHGLLDWGRPMGNEVW
jgi:antitoxin MazE